MIDYRRLFARITCALIPFKDIRKRCRLIFLYGHLKDLLVKRAGLRRFSGPFDWVSDAPFERRIELLSEGLSDFFRREDLVSSGEKVVYAEGSLEPHTVYYNKHTKLRHPHDFSFHGEFKKDFEALAKKYERRCKRLIHLLKTSKRVLLVYGETDRGVDFLDRGRVVSLLAKLQAVYPAVIDLLYLKRNCAMSPEEVEIKSHALRGGGLYFGLYRGLDAEEASPEAEKINERLRRSITLWLIVHIALRER